MEIIEGKIYEELKKMITTPERIEKLYFSQYDSIKGLLDEVSNEKKKDLVILGIWHVSEIFCFFSYFDFFGILGAVS